MTRPRPRRNQPPPPPLSQTLAARLQVMIDDMIRREKALARPRDKSAAPTHGRLTRPRGPTS